MGKQNGSIEFEINRYIWGYTAIVSERRIDAAYTQMIGKKYENLEIQKKWFSHAKLAILYHFEQDFVVKHELK